MESWIVWLVLAALLGVAEIMTTTLAFGLLAATTNLPLSPPRRRPASAWCGHWRCATSGSLHCCGLEHPPWSDGPPR